MNGDRPAMRMKLTVTKIGIRQRIEGKPYERMDFEATTDKTSKVIPFLTFSPDVMDAVLSGKPFDADIVVEDGQSKVIKVLQPDSREASIKAQTAVKAVAEMLAGKVVVPKKIKDNHFKLIEQWQTDAIK